jgi:hypothetical protein
MKILKLERVGWLFYLNVYCNEKLIDQTAESAMFACDVVCIRCIIFAM